MTVVALVHHRVQDFDAWKAVYDALADAQRAGGVREQAVMRAADHFFSENPDLRDAMARAGVDTDSFRPELLDEVARGRL